MGALLAAAAAYAAGPLTNFNVVLLQPSPVLEARVTNVDAMAAYVRAVEAASREAVVASGARQSVGGFIVVAVKPGLKSNVWLDFDTLTDLEMQKQIVTRVRAIKPFEASQGPVVFALKVATWDGRESRRSAPLPPEWRNATQGQSAVEIGDLVERVWQD